MLKLEIVTPERKVVDAEVDSVSVPTASGEAGILPNHAPLISALKPGILSYSAKGTSEKLAISGGFVEVNGSYVSVLATTAAAAADINIDEAKADRDAAEKALASVASSAIEDTETYREALDAANAKIMIAGGR